MFAKSVKIIVLGLNVFYMLELHLSNVTIGLEGKIHVKFINRNVLSSFLIGLLIFQLHSSDAMSMNSEVVPDALPDNSRSNLATTIKKSIDTFDEWASSDLVVRGIVLGLYTVKDLEIRINESAHYGSWDDVFIGKNYADLLNYTSPVIDNAVKKALDNYTMFKNYALPKNRANEDYFNLWGQFALYGFKYAKELNYQRVKWDPYSAFEGLKNCRDANGQAFYFCNPDTSSTLDGSGTRWMSTANLASCFIMLYEVTNDTEMLDYALQEWQDLNDYYWSETKQAYDYARNWRIWEWSTIEVFFNYEKLRKANGSLDNWDRVYTDLQNRYLRLMWDSPQWGSQVVVHSEGASQRRLHGTLDAWLMLLTYFGYFSEGNQNNMKAMLEGTSNLPSWQGILEPGAGFYDPSTCQFKLDSDDTSTSDYATSEGILTLILNGISPQNGGGLIIPKRADGYSGGVFPVDILRFWYDEQKIMIPVYANTTLKFLYGDTQPEYPFTEHGLYNVSFTSDWNSIVDVELVKAVEVDPADVPRRTINSSSSTTSTMTTTPTTTTSSTTSTTSTMQTCTDTTTDTRTDQSSTESFPTNTLTIETTTTPNPTQSTSTSDASNTNESETQSNTDDSNFLGLGSYIVAIFFISIVLRYAVKRPKV